MPQPHNGPDSDQLSEPYKQPGRGEPIVTEWADVYESAERWVAWTARRRWPTHPVNDQVWAISAATWETYGRRVAA